MKRLLERLFPTLRWKIGLAIVIVLLIADGGFLFFAHRTGFSMLEEQSQLKAHGITDVMKSVVEQAMLSGDSNRVQQALDDVSRSSSIKNAFLLRPDGAIRRESRSAGTLSGASVAVVGSMKRVEVEQNVSTQEDDSMYIYLISPLKKKAECSSCHKTSEAIIGYVGLRLATEDFRTLALQHRTLNIFMTVLIFIGLGGIMFIALLLLVIRPIHGLHSHIRQIEGGMTQLESGEHARFPLLDESHERDEIADLCRDFNSMMRRLNAANQKIFELHSTQLEQADRLATTGEMAASMAHEIKNPVAGVLGALQVIEAELDPEDRRREILSEMRTQLERVTHALNDLLTYARPTPPLFDELDVVTVIGRTSTLLSGQFKGKNITIHPDLPTGPLLISADKKQFQQVIWNIMLNGMQAIGSSGNLFVSAASENSCVVVKIKDDGKGIPDEDLQRVFKPFYTTKHKGTGLGMTICKRLVEMHHGSIRIESAVGCGTTVTITLPQRQKGS